MSKLGNQGRRFGLTKPYCRFSQYQRPAQIYRIGCVMSSLSVPQMLPGTFGASIDGGSSPAPDLSGRRSIRLRAMRFRKGGFGFSIDSRSSHLDSKKCQRPCSVSWGSFGQGSYCFVRSTVRRVVHMQHPADREASSVVIVTEPALFLMELLSNVWKCDSHRTQSILLE